MNYGTDTWTSSLFFRLPAHSCKTWSEFPLSVGIPHGARAFPHATTWYFITGFIANQNPRKTSHERMKVLIS